MFCHGCLTRYLNACLIAFRFAQATMTAWLTGDVPAAYSYALRFVQLWHGLNPWGRTTT
jgi:hypothetical protein